MEWAMIRQIFDYLMKFFDGIVNYLYGIYG